MKRLMQQRGQAAVESAIVFPMLIFFILGLLQLTLVQQARLMLEYAAFSAARAGSVWNMDSDKMHAAAIVALLPTMPTTATDVVANPCPQGLRVDEVPNFLCRWGVLKVNNRFTDTAFGGKKLIHVETLNPSREDFNNEKEIEFDQVGSGLAQRKNSQLTIRLTYFYNLRLPIVNWVFFESWLASLSGAKLRGLNPWAPKINGMKLGTTTRMAIEANEAKTNCTFSGISSTNIWRLVIIGRTTGRYFLPLVTTYTIRMQSNPFLRFASPRGQGC